ncbi:MAG: DUF4494 domain-containing protein [Bacteroidales bacterium]|jgi:hypothetical protein|nr:DUF4494 domain-containing protein [Bacteroidales bacterium]MBO7379614.1 DUF4494 domain-containing protein [Bacteroidales bacterium]MBP5763523.1 DUF4494 domain-containing protein [Bacteroidales bacterium]
MAMNNWYECKVKFEKTLENGIQKKVTETYLVDAMSFTEAENRIIEEMTPYISGEFEVTAVKKNRISELFADPEGDRWYRAKVMFVTLDEKSGNEKKSPSTMLVQAKDFQMAVKNLEDGMKGTMSDWEINTISETSILDVFGVVVKETKPAE